MAKKVVLVTGASRGIGKAIAVKFAKKGYNVIINCAHREQELMQTKKEIESYQVTCAAFLGDMGDMAVCEQLFSMIRKQFGSLDVLVNNAGIDYIGLLQDMSPEDWDRILRTNLTSVFNCCKLAIPLMLPAGHGKIVNISSVWGCVGASCEVAYSAAKAAVIGLTRALAKELGPSGITVNCVSPGVISTEMNAHLDQEALAALAEETPLGAIGTPEDVAEAIWYLSSDAARFVTGQVLAPNGGLVI